MTPRGPYECRTLSQSDAIDDPAWDSFLEATPLGQFQQSTMWARYKRFEGWETTRYAFYKNDRIVGGFQILSRKTRIGRVGYVPKGPVLPESDAETVEWTADMLVRATRDQNLLALIVQPPDEDLKSASVLDTRGFQECRALGIIDATMVIPLGRAHASIEREMKDETRMKIRQAVRRGVTVTEGDERDLSTFFELMLSTCRRQREEHPNPSTYESLRSLWEAFRTTNHIGLTFARHNGKILAGLLCVTFGRRVTLWKKGWCTEGTELRPNDLLYADSIVRAHQNGLALYDFAGANREIAETLSNGQLLSSEQQRSRDYFHIRFGGIPRLLPKATIYFKAPLIRIALPLLNVPSISKIAKNRFTSPC